MAGLRLASDQVQLTARTDRAGRVLLSRPASYRAIEIGCRPGRVFSRRSWFRFRLFQNLLEMIRQLQSAGGRRLVVVEHACKRFAQQRRLRRRFRRDGKRWCCWNTLFDVGDEFRTESTDNRMNWDNGFVRDCVEATVVDVT